MPKPKNKCCDNVIPYNAARPFKKPAPVLSRSSVRELLDQNKGADILELGAGGLRNALYLQKAGFKVHVVEVEGIEERFSERYQDFRKAGGKVYYSFPEELIVSVALATFVIETICRVDERLQLLQEIYNSLKDQGALVISVRGPADLVTATARGLKCSDGYLTPNMTFARSYTRTQLNNLLRKCGFDQVDFLHKEHVKQPEYLHAVGWKRKK